jgi:hypothetical protein
MSKKYLTLTETYKLVLEQQQTNLKPGIVKDPIKDIVNDIKVDKIVADLDSKRNIKVQQQDSEERKYGGPTTEVEATILHIANELFDIGSRINSGHADKIDAERLMEFSTELEKVMGALQKEYDIKPKKLDIEGMKERMLKKLEAQ